MAQSYILRKLGLYGGDSEEIKFEAPQNLSKLTYFQWPTQELFDEFIQYCPDTRVQSLQVFRSEDELDMEGIVVTLNNGAQSATSGTEQLGVSVDSSLHTTMDFSDLQQIRRISI